MAPNFSTVGVYRNRLGKIRLSDYHGKKYVILIFYVSFFVNSDEIRIDAIFFLVHFFLIFHQKKNSVFHTLFKLFFSDLNITEGFL